MAESNEDQAILTENVESTAKLVELAENLDKSGSATELASKQGEQDETQKTEQLKEAENVTTGQLLDLSIENVDEQKPKSDEKLPEKPPSPPEEVVSKPKETINETSPPPSYKSHESANGSSIQEQQNHRMQEFDEEDEEVESEVRNLHERISHGRNLRFSKSARTLAIYGTVSLLLGLAFLLCGVVSFVFLTGYQSRSSVQIEWKWTNLILVFSGSSALILIRKQTITSICVTVILSLLATCMGVCTFFVHIVNLVFRRKDIQYFRENKQLDMVPTAIKVGNLNLALLLLGLLSAIVSILLLRHSLHIAGKNFAYLRHVDRHRFRLSMFAFVQLILGILITGWWIAIEVIFHGTGTDLHSLPTSEVLAHGMVIACTGYMQMMATSKGSQPMLNCAAVLNGASFLLAIFFSPRPLGIMYFVLDQVDATMMAGGFDLRFGLCAMLAFFYFIEVICATYSLIKFLHLACGDRISRIDNLLERYRHLFRIFAAAQIFLGTLYAVLEIISVSLLVAYKLDFTPLPLYVIASGVLVHGASRMGSTMLLCATQAVTMLCLSFSIRDVYLFAYHAITHGNTPDKPQNMQLMNGTNLGVHFALSLTALVELAVSIGLTVVVVRCLTGSLACIYNRLQFPRTLKHLKTTAIIQTVFGVCIMILGLVLFLSRRMFLVDFGDLSITTGLFLFLVGLISVYGSEKKPILLVPAVFGQLAAFTLVWQQMDEFAYLIHFNLRGDGSRFKNDVVNLVLTLVVFALLVVYLLLCGTKLLMQGAVLEASTFTKLEMNGAKTDETVAMSDPWNIDDNEESENFAVQQKA